MNTIYLKTEFVNILMDYFGYRPKDLKLAPEIQYWVAGVTGYYNRDEKHFMSFAEAQRLCAGMVNYVKEKHHYSELVYIELSYKELTFAGVLAERVVKAAYLTDPSFILNFGQLKYSKKTKTLIDESGLRTLRIK